LIHKVSAKFHSIKLVELFTRNNTKLIWYFLIFLQFPRIFQSLLEKELKEKGSFTKKTPGKIAIFAIGSLVGIRGGGDD